MKKIQQVGAGMLLTLGLLLATACSNELETTGEGGKQEEKVTLHANLTKSGVQTRMNFKDEGTNGVKTTWSEGDAIMVYVTSGSSSFHGSVFTLTAGAGTDAGTFEGKLPEETGSGYMIVYPASRMPETLTEHSVTSMLGQVQNGNDNMNHLSDYNFIIAQTSDLESNITFSAEPQLLTFDLTLPATYHAEADGAPTRLDIKGDFGINAFGEGEPINIISLGLQNITMGEDRKLKAHILTKTDMGAGDNMQISLITEKGTIYSFTRNLTKDIYQGGSRYTATIGESDWDDTGAQTFSNETAAATGFDGGNGSSATPYLIANAAQLKYFAEQVNGGTNYSSQYIKLTTDIYVTADVWTPIGTSASRYFAGNFDGDRHTIYGKLHATTAGQASDTYFGFFGYSQCNIKNLKINADVKGGSTNNGNYHVGGIVGHGMSSLRSTFTIENCQNYGTVTGGNSTNDTGGTTCVGGIIGYSEVHITNCNNYGKITARGGGTSTYTGGVCGWIKASSNICTNCSNSGDVTGATTTQAGAYTGGVIGLGYKTLNCTNSGIITVNEESGSTTTYAQLGGIIGNIYNKEMHQCLNIGNIKKTHRQQKAGGLAGSNGAAIYSCNTHEGTVLEADGTPTTGNPAIGYQGGSTPTCTDSHNQP